MIEVDVRIDADDLRANLDDLVQLTSGPRRKAMMLVIGKGLEGDLRRYFRRKNLEPNKRGWKKQNFWGRIRRATSLTDATADGATVTIADPAIAAKVYGAEIRPYAPRKYLAIPAREEAYGIQPSSGLIPDLFVRRSKTTGRPYLARREDDGSLRVYYWLARKVRVPADPDALPHEDDLGEAAGRRAMSWLRREMKGGLA